jgi:hypothetical protein
MTLPRPLKLRLIERFAPLLYVDPKEPDYPVSPELYVAHAALWSSQPPAHARNTWGVPAGPDRLPLITRGGIDVNSGVFLLPLASGHELWLDLNAWQDGQQVTQTSVNRRSAAQPAPQLAQPWFSADVWDMPDVRQVLGAQAVATRFGIGPDDHPDQLTGIVVVAYHFLFPSHRQGRALTAHPPDVDPYSGDYEGDWTSFAVVTRAYVGHGQPLGEHDCVPVYGAFGQRWRPVYPDHEGFMFERMMLVRWGHVLHVDEHPLVVAAPGTHNLYPHDMPKTPGGTIEVQWTDMGKSVSEPANAFVRDSTESPLAGLYAAKVLAGLAVGGLPGAIIGGIAAGAEASAAEKEGIQETPKLNPDPPLERDDPLEEDATDLAKNSVAKPGSVQVPPLVDPSQSSIRDWLPDASEALVDDSRVTSPYHGADRPTFPGRWGVRCANDPFLIRSGIFLPAYRSQIIDALLRATI